MKNGHLNLLFLFIFFTSCSDQQLKSDIEQLNIVMHPDSIFVFKTGVIGHQEGFAITRQASHYRISEIKRSEETDWESIYYYQSVPDFSGSDSIEIEMARSSDRMSLPTRKRRVRIHFILRKESIARTNATEGSRIYDGAPLAVLNWVGK